MTRRTPALLALGIAVSLTGCAIGPNYHRPSAPAAAHFKAEHGWQPAVPARIVPSDWWSIYRDPVLSHLEGQVEVSNQNLKAAGAAYYAAREAAGGTRGTLLPSINLGASQTRSGGGAATAFTFGGARTSNQAGASASWDIDLWGRLRRELQSANAQAQASAADVAAAAQGLASAAESGRARLSPFVALLAPVTPGVAASFEAAGPSFIPFTALANILGLPATAFPARLTDRGLPAGVRAAGVRDCGSGAPGTWACDEPPWRRRGGGKTSAHGSGFGGARPCARSRGRDGPPCRARTRPRTSCTPGCASTWVTRPRRPGASRLGSGAELQGGCATSQPSGRRTASCWRAT